MAEIPETTFLKKQSLLRCMDWLQKQNSQEPKKLSLQNKNDIQFIIQTNADRKNFLLSAAEDVATVPPGVNEPLVEPRIVPLKKLRVIDLHMECEWLSCRWAFNDYEAFQKHVTKHIPEIQTENNYEYSCKWDVCGYKTTDYGEMVRHINYHSYHTKLLAIGYNGRATLKLARCKKDSSHRNQLPVLPSEHCCMWTGCNETFNSIQTFFNHVGEHTKWSEDNLCSWAGCGATFPRRVLLVMHVRSHTCERLIACYHCGRHFASNRKLCDHLRRQNVNPNSGFSCAVCGQCCATEYLLRSHARRHISAYACALCDMSAPSPGALALHVRHRHFAHSVARVHACPHCAYRAVSKSDLQKHIPIHTRKKKSESDECDSDEEVSDEENSDVKRRRKCKKKTNVSTKKYACHMCPKKEMKVFTRGARLTTHLMKAHGAQWPFGHSRFKYQISDDGMYRLTTTRIEFLDVSEKIVDGYSGPKGSLNNSFEFNLELKAEATMTAPRRYEITLKNHEDRDDNSQVKDEIEVKPLDNVEITMCDVDEKGNIINSEVIIPDFLYT